jgi:glucose-6-phosphatase
MGYLGGKSNLQSLSLPWYCFAAVLFLSSSPAVIHLVNVAGWDASWSVALAKKWCAKPEWVYLDTTPLYAVTRDASQLLGTLGMSSADFTQNGI